MQLKFLAEVNYRDFVGRMLILLIGALCLSAEADTDLSGAESVHKQITLRHQASPRIEPVERSAIDDESIAVLLEMREAIGSEPPETLPESFTMMANHPELMRLQFQLSAQLYNGVLSPRDRELAIMRIAWLCQAPYEWGEHVTIGKRIAGLTTSDIERITLGSVAPEWTDHERAILLAVEELFSTATITDQTWEMLDRTLDKKQLYELPVLVGTYQMLAYVHKALQFRLRSGNSGLDMR